MIYNILKEHLAEAKAAKNKPAISDIIGVIDAVDKKVFAEKKKAGEGYIIEDAVVIAVIKNQIKNVRKDYDKAVSLVGANDQTDLMQDVMERLGVFLPDAVEGDDLRMIIQGLGASNMGQAMGMLKKQSLEVGFDYDGKEASVLAKEIFV